MIPTNNLSKDHSSDSPPHTPSKDKWYADVGEDWERIIKQTKKSFLVLNGALLSRTWTLADAIRDVVQNALDRINENHRNEHQSCKCMLTVQSPPSAWQGDQKIEQRIRFINDEGKKSEPVGYLCWEPKDEKNKGPTVTISNRNARFGHEGLIIGCSSKADQDAGGHGEGLKSAATIACREGLHFEIYQSGLAIYIEKKEKFITFRALSPNSKKNHYRKKTADLAKKLGISPKQDVIVHMGDGEALQFQHLQSAANKFLFLTHRRQHFENGDFPAVDIKETASGRSLLFGDGFAGKVYVRGIFFEGKKKYQQAYGINLIKSDALNRDRNIIAHEDYKQACGTLLSDVLATDPSFAMILLKEFDDASKDPMSVEHLTELPNVISDQAKKLLIEAYRSMPSNRDVKYVVSGRSDTLLTDNDLVPRWCDVRACKVVYPLLYDLICAGYPTPNVIKQNCKANLIDSSPLDPDATLKLHHWMLANEQLLVIDNQKLTKEYVDLMQVRNTGDRFDVPQFVIVDNTDSTSLCQVIIFSSRAISKMKENPREFLNVVAEALKAAYTGETLSDEEPDRQDEDSEIAEIIAPNGLDESSNSSQKSSQLSDLESKEHSEAVDELEPIIPEKPRQVALGSDFDQPSFGLNDIVPHDENAQVQELINSLRTHVSFGKHTIHCTKAASEEWKAVASKNKKILDLIASKAISSCQWALEHLTSSPPRLNFYLAPDSTVQGYATQEGGIHINLRSVLLHASSKKHPDRNRMKAYFNVLMAHEYAHSLNIKDGHSSAHGRRTEENMQKLMAEMITSAKERDV